ncbi:DUF3631 domain-containing protein [Lentzea sp. BCCO 10_0798]|uniref:DUF3631 domain-containing protein n=1 Tax=Lentzea kristufekii TaxID=3095430 RepID=A0ABU4TJR5_9PSEU|nr:DUF3631 domain-containing protein [Lentzea sp. BCCO 10_0798]MDX8048504.1 DUF3631 domain-containing protein [Lentzea sp. BCCO 10_0798]
MLALWYAHTWVADHLYTTPRLVLSSAEPGSGKTRVLEVAKHFTKAAEMTMSGSAAALVRMVAAGPITILLDEVDTIFAGGGGGNEEVRGMLNGGYKRTATIPKCRGDAATGITVDRLPIFAPAALAGLAGSLPDTINTRAITIHLRKRRNDEHVQSYMERRVDREATPIREALESWVTSIGESLEEAEPTMPHGVADRAAEIWEPLIAIADAAGGHWPTTARTACSYFVHDKTGVTPSLGVQLLTDLWTLFKTMGTDRLHTTEILRCLLTLDDSPWTDLNGRPLDARRLSKELRRYHVAPITVKCNDTNAKGYVTFANDHQVGLADAWARYLPALATEGEK